MAKDFEKKLKVIFSAHNSRVEQLEREAEAEKKRRFEKVMKMHDHLSKVVVPSLRQLAVAIQMNGQKVTVVETGPMGSPETSTAQAKITIIPRGHETSDPNELPRLLFQSGPPGITVTEYVHFPGRGGHSSTSQAYMPSDLTTEKVESMLLGLIERTFCR